MRVDMRVDGRVEEGSGPSVTIRSALAAAAVALVMGLAGCSGDESADQPPEVQPGRSGAAGGLGEEHINGHVDEHVDEVHAPLEETATAEERDPVAAARRFLEAWSRPELSYGEWWAGVEPLLNAAGAEAYVATVPQLVPRLEATGPAVVDESGVATSSTVWIPTNGGRFGIRMSRGSDREAWRVARIIFPTAQTGPGGPGFAGEDGVR